MPGRRTGAGPVELYKLANEGALPRYAFKMCALFQSSKLRVRTNSCGASHWPSSPTKCYAHSPPGWSTAALRRKRRFWARASSCSGGRQRCPRGAGCTACTATWRRCSAPRSITGCAARFCRRAALSSIPSAAPDRRWTPLRSHRVAAGSAWSAATSLRSLCRSHAATAPPSPRRLAEEREEEERKWRRRRRRCTASRRVCQLWRAG